jgi:ribosomal-protein-alanine N-acetyltransferase
MNVPRSITCETIELRMITPRYADRLYALARDPDVSRMLQWPPHGSIEESLEFIHDARRLWDLRRAWIVGVFNAADGTLLGSTGISHIDPTNRRGEVGTWFGTPHQGNGYNRPTKAALASFAFDVLRLHRLEFLVRTDNATSLAAMRRLPGVTEECTLRGRLFYGGEARDAILFALLADDFDPSVWPTVTFDR